MAQDREILRMIWEGQIAICFQADPDEIVGLQQPENFHLMVSRLSYLPLVTDKVGKKNKFSSFYQILNRFVCVSFNFRLKSFLVDLLQTINQMVLCGLIIMAFL